MFIAIFFTITIHQFESSAFDWQLHIKHRFIGTACRFRRAFGVAATVFEHRANGRGCHHHLHRAVACATETRANDSTTPITTKTKTSKSTVPSQTIFIQPILSCASFIIDTIGTH
jgi:hypothetical protein